MAKRLSANAPQPRSRITFPGYPTLAAASIYLCLAGGCSREPASNDPSSMAGSTTGGTTGAGGTTATGGTTLMVGPTSTGGYLAGGAGEPFDETPTPVEDAGIPNLPPTPDAAAADAVEASSPQDAAQADLAPAEISPPALSGGAMPPH